MNDFRQPLPIVPFFEARSLLERYAAKLSPTDTEVVPLADAAGRVLATDICADRDLPPFVRSTRDGYALRAVDTTTPPTTFTVTGEIKAGVGKDQLADVTAPHECVAIMTGAPVPKGADCVLMVEHARPLEGPQILTSHVLNKGENVVPRGAEARQGSVLLHRGSRLKPAAIAVAAAVGASRIEVYKRPKVAIVATGDELVNVSEQPEAFQIRNSNSWSLAAQVRRAGGDPVIFPVAPDERERTRELFASALGLDLLLSSGGVSLGTYDLVEDVLAEFSARVRFTGVAIQPGKPVVFCDCVRPDDGGPRVPVFGLPGNPVSTMVTFEVLAKVVLDALCGLSPCPLRFTHLPLASPIVTKHGVTRFLPAVIHGEGVNCSVELVNWQGSGDFAAAARADCLLVIEPYREKLAAGDFVPVLFPQAEL